MAEFGCHLVSRGDFTQSHTVTSVFYGEIGFALFSLSLHFHCREREKEGDFDTIKVITLADNNNPTVVLFSAPQQAHQNCQKSLVSPCKGLS